MELNNYTSYLICFVLSFSILFFLLQKREKDIVKLNEERKVDYKNVLKKSLIGSVFSLGLMYVFKKYIEHNEIKFDEGADIDIKAVEDIKTKAIQSSKIKMENIKITKKVNGGGAPKKNIELFSNQKLKQITNNKASSNRYDDYRIPFDKKMVSSVTSSSSLPRINTGELAKYSSATSTSSVKSGIRRPDDMVPLNNTVKEGTPVILQQFSNKIEEIIKKSSETKILDGIIVKEASF
jgi:hypothetical protein